MRKKLLLFMACLLIRSTYAQENGDGSVTQVQLTPEQVVAFKDQAVKSVEDLGTYMKILVDKSNPIERRNKHVELSIKLFVNDSTTVEVTSLNGKDKYYRKIRKYLYLVRDLPYQSVDITWSGIYLSKDFVLGADGKYYGVASICQKFCAKNLGNKLDVRQWNIEQTTCKQITIVIQKIEGEGKNVWILRLGDIKVDEARKN